MLAVAGAVKTITLLVACPVTSEVIAQAVVVIAHQEMAYMKGETVAMLIDYLTMLLRRSIIDKLI